MIDVRRVLIWVAKRRYATTLLYPILSYFVSEGTAFVHSCLPIPLWIGSDYQPRWGALSREMRVSIAPNRRRNGIEGNDERCNTDFVRSHVLFSFPFPHPRSPHLSFSGFNIRSNRPPSFLFGIERFCVRIGFSCGRQDCEKGCKQTILQFTLFLGRVFSSQAQNVLHVWTLRGLSANSARIN